MAKIKNQNLIIVGGKEPVLQEKSVEITENTTTTITADEGFDGLSKVDIITNVAGSGGGGSDNFKALVEGTMTELTAEDLSGVTNIRPNAFTSLSIEKATIPSSVQTIGNYSFQQTQLKEIVFSEGLKNIGLSAFYGSSSARLLGNQTSLIFPSTLETIGSYAFSYSDLSKVTEIYFPDSVTSLGGCFSNILLENCNITFGSGLTTFPASLFYNAKNKADNYTSKVYFRFNGDVTLINNEAFGSVKGARLFDFRNCTSVPTLAALSGISSYTTRNFTIVVPDALYDSWRTATNWSTIKSKIKKVSEYTG